MFEENDQALLDFVSYAKENAKILDKNIDFSILNLLPMHKRQNDIVPLLLDLPLSFLTFDHREHLLKRLVDTFNVSSVKLILNDIETRGSRKTLRNIYGYSIEDKELDNPDSEVFRAVFEFNNRIKGFLPISPSIIKKAVEKKQTAGSALIF